MQCHAIVLDTTGTAYARQQPRYSSEREKKRKANKEKGKRRIGKRDILRKTEVLLRGTNTPKNGANICYIK